MMSVDNLKARMPAYAKDIKLNLSNIFQSTALTEAQVWARRWRPRWQPVMQKSSRPSRKGRLKS